MPSVERIGRSVELSDLLLSQLYGYSVIIHEDWPLLSRIFRVNLSRDSLHTYILCSSNVNVMILRSTFSDMYILITQESGRPMYAAFGRLKT